MEHRVHAPSACRRGGVALESPQDPGGSEQQSLDSRHVQRHPEEPRAWSPLWPHRVIEFCATLRQQDGLPAARHATYSDLWLLLATVLRQRVRSQARRLGALSLEDIQDLATEKTLEVLSQIDDGQWDPTLSSPNEVAGFLTHVARNGIVDHLRRRQRAEQAVGAEPGRPLAQAVVPPEAPDIGIERQRFVAALVECVRGLKPRHQVIWFFRVCYEMPTKLIATHPEVGLEIGNVDVILQRCREQVRTCMGAKGLAPTDLPRGTFTTLWAALRREALPTPGRTA